MAENPNNPIQIYLEHTGLNNPITLRPVELSSHLLYQIRCGNDVSSTLEDLNSLTVKQITILHTDAKTAFWINLYNAFFLYLHRQGIVRSLIFQETRIQIAGCLLSLDDIEHRILRKGALKWSLGYLRNPFLNKTIRLFQPEKTDFRIHFALNCGARGCPLIRFYSDSNLNQELEMATETFILGDTVMNEKTKTLAVSRIFLWYNADFGGKRGIRSLHERWMNRSFKGYNLTYRSYDFRPVDEFFQG